MPNPISRAVSATRWQAALHWHTLGQDPVIVFAPPKIGSRTLTETMRSATGAGVLHAHWVTRTGVNRTRTWWSDHAGITEPAPAHHRGNYIRHRLALPHRGRWRIITGVRDPVARLVAEFFQVGSALDLFGVPDEAADEDIGALTTQFLDWASTAPSTRDWYADELRAATNIDPYEHAFPTGRGYETYENDRCRVLLVRTEDMRRIAPRALAEFLELPDDVTLTDSNTASRKAYAETYDRFRRSAELPEWFLDEHYDGVPCRHFYTDDERARFRSMWTRGDHVDA